MKKRILAVFLVVAVILPLAACGKGERTSETDSSENEEVDIEESRDIPALDIEKENTVPRQGEDRDETVLEFKTAASIDETVLYDENDIKITAAGLNYSDDSVELGLVIENHTDQNLSFVSGITGSNRNAVNGYMIPDSYGYWQVDVDAGKREEAAYSFDMDELLSYGIVEIAEIQMGFFVQDEAYDHTILGPFLVKTSAAESYDLLADTYQEIMKSGMMERIGNCTVNYYGEDELYSHGGVRVVSEALITNQSGEKVVLLEIVNDSPEVIYGTATEISVNGLIVSASEVMMRRDDSINPGARRIKAWTLNELLHADFLEAFGITDVGEFSCLFTVKDEDYKEIISQEEMGFKVPEEASFFDVAGAEVYNENGIRIVSKGLFRDHFEYSHDVAMIFLIENRSSGEIYIDADDHSVYVNGSVADSMAIGKKVPFGKYAAFNVELSASWLDETGIRDIEDIAETELTFNIKDTEGNIIVKPVISVEF